MYYRDSVKSMGDTLKDLMVLLKLREGSLSVTPRPFSLYKVIEYLSESNAEMMISCNVRLECEIDETIPNMVLGDKINVNHILNNLLKNAIQNSPTDSSVLLSISRQPDNASDIVFNVTDHGNVILESEYESVFEPFKLVTHDVPKKFRNNLDLTICKELVFVSGGVIGLSSGMMKNDKDEEVPTNTFQVVLTLPEGKEEDLLESDKILFEKALLIKQSFKSDIASILQRIEQRISAPSEELYNTNKTNFDNVDPVVSNSFKSLADVKALVVDGTTL